MAWAHGMGGDRHGDLRACGLGTAVTNEHRCDDGDATVWTVTADCVGCRLWHREC